MFHSVPGVPRVKMERFAYVDIAYIELTLINLPQQNVTLVPQR